MHLATWQVTFYLDHSSCLAETDAGSAYGLAEISSSSCLASGHLLSYGTTRVYGERKTSWSLLTQDTPAGATSLHVAECDGWRVGDEISIAPTDRGEGDGSKAEEFTLAGVVRAADGASCEVTLSGPLVRRRLGSDSALAGFVVRAEVLHLSRSVTFTGPTYQRGVGGGHQGIVTSQRLGGSMQLHYTRVDNCGRALLGEYCTHFHWVGHCADCRLVGSVITRGTGKGTTVHGTHDALLQDNVYYDIRGASIYFENGQELYNVVERNVVGCPEL